jgi:protein-tyrosine phosphatase
MPHIKLIAPENGSVTEPLQQHELPPDVDLLNDGRERSLPQGVSFAWDAHPSGDATYELLISTTLDFNAPLGFIGLSEPQAEVFHLHIGTPYFWKVVAKRGGQSVAESPVWNFTTNDTTPRWIWVPGTSNVRDLGGWSLPENRMVRQGVFYRSAKLDAPLEVTAEGRRVLLDELGIRTDLDFRGATEFPGPVLDATRVQWVNVPISAYEHIRNEASQAGYRKLFEMFADSANHPILFHCWGGADRAGTVAFLLNALLGVKLEDLTRDYELTSLSTLGVRSGTSVHFNNLVNALAPFSEDENNYTEKAENYLLSIGVTQDAIGAIRAHLIVDCSDV